MEIRESVDFPPPPEDKRQFREWFIIFQNQKGHFQNRKIFHFPELNVNMTFRAGVKLAACGEVKKIYQVYVFDFFVWSSEQQQVAAGSQLHS